MVKDAEKYKEEDDKQRDRLQAKNSLESYAFNMKQTIEDDKLKDKITDDDRKTVLDKCNDVISWIDGNQVQLTLSRSHTGDILSCVKIYRCVCFLFCLVLLGLDAFRNSISCNISLSVDIYFSHTCDG